MEHLINENNWLYQIKTRSGKLVRKLLGMKCPHCGQFFKENPTYNEWSVDAAEHITYCNPAHQRAMSGESA